MIKTSKPERSGTNHGASAGAAPSPGPPRRPPRCRGSRAETNRYQPRQRNQPPVPSRRRLHEPPGRAGGARLGKGGGTPGSGVPRPAERIAPGAAAPLPERASRGAGRAPRARAKPRAAAPLFAGPPGAAAAGRPPEPAPLRRGTHLPPYKAAGRRREGRRAGAGWLSRPLPALPCPGRWRRAPRPSRLLRSAPRTPPRPRHPRRRFRATRPGGRRGSQWAAAPRRRAALVGAGRSQWEAAPPRRFTTSGYGRPRGLRASGMAARRGRAGGWTDGRRRRGRGRAGPGAERVSAVVRSRPVGAGVRRARTGGSAPAPPWRRPGRGVPAVVAATARSPRGAPAAAAAPRAAHRAPAHAGAFRGRPQSKKSPRNQNPAQPKKRNLMGNTWTAGGPTCYPPTVCRARRSGGARASGGGREGAPCPPLAVRDGGTDTAEALGFSPGGGEKHMAEF